MNKKKKKNVAGYLQSRFSTQCSQSGVNDFKMEDSHSVSRGHFSTGSLSAKVTILRSASIIENENARA